MDEQAFLAAIEANPEDDAIRGIFADWLDEHDRPEDANRQRKWKSSDRWLRDYAEQTWCDYGEMMAVAATHCGDGRGDYLCDGGIWEGVRTDPEFWTHYEVITGRKPPERDYTPNFFTCSC